VEIEVVAGVTAALSGARGAGRAAGARFLRDLPVRSADAVGDVIEKRLLLRRRRAISALCLYNPALQKAGGLSAPGLRHAAALPGRLRHGSAAGCATSAATGQAEPRADAEELRDERLDMFTTVFVGSSSHERNLGRSAW
jgi:precorrin-3B C17-methyltransferase